MRIHRIRSDRAIEPVDSIEALPDDGFVWIDASAEGEAANWRTLAERLNGVTLFDAHMADAASESHPSHFDSTGDYELITFRGLAAHAESREEPVPGRHPATPVNTTPYRIRTHPVVFFILHRTLVTVHRAESPAIEAVRARLVSGAMRAPASPADLAYRFLNGMVDRYLALRAPLSERLDRWQRNLLDPRRPFNDWHALLEQRIEIRKLEHLCEEQRDAIQEWRDHRFEQANDAMTVRVNDLLEHIARVMSHAQRLEQTAESAVQLHFSATAHRTNEIMRTLTIITAVFMPLTLITGIFGMNFRVIPGAEIAWGFWATLGAMAAVATTLLGYFRYKRYLETSGRNRR